MIGRFEEFWDYIATLIKLAIFTYLTISPMFIFEAIQMNFQRVPRKLANSFAPLSIYPTFRKFAHLLTQISSPR